jgi:ribonuclease-3
MLPYREIEEKLGYTFTDKTLLEEAFTHSSFAGRYRVNSNERMEYLGDAVLQLVVTEWQFLKDGNADEGRLTKSRQKLVCKDALDTAVDALEIWQYLKATGRLQNNVGGKAKSSLFEAVIAAIYLDGGYEPAKKFILRHGNLILDFTEDNPIGQLKEYLEKHKEKEPKEEWEKFGADNSPTFKLTLTAMGESAKGEGRSKHEARATASTRLLWELKNRKK